MAEPITLGFQVMRHTESVNLCEDDQQAFDALLAAGFNPKAVDPQLQPRAKRLAQVMGLLDNLPAPSPGDLLVERTIQRIHEARQKERYTQQIQSLSGSTGPGFRWTELVAAAAMVLIGISLIWPTFSRSRANAQQYACQANLATAGMGFASYARDHGGLMPAVKSRPGDPWWNINQFDEHGYTRSNSAHLFVMIRHKYLKPEDLSCSGNAGALRNITMTMRDWPSAASTSYSYQNQFTHRPNRLNGRMAIAVLADKNPLFKPGGYREDLDPTSLSPNHVRLRVQNVLMTSGEVLRLTAPLINQGDNIWQVRDMTTAYTKGQPVKYTGCEVPSDETDSFLVP